MTSRLSLKIVAIVAVALSLLVLGGILIGIWQQSKNPEQIFQRALAQNLTETGVTCSVLTTNPLGTTKQTVDLDLEQRAKAHINWSTMVKRDNNVLSLDFEEITIGADTYSRYLKLTTTSKDVFGNPLDFSDRLNIWHKSPTPRQKGLVYDETALGNCIVPLAHLSTDQASLRIKQLEKNTIFTTRYDQAKQSMAGGREVLIYNVSVQSRPYVEFMKQIGHDYGAQYLGALNADSYATKKPETLQVSVDMGAGRIVKIVDSRLGKTIVFSNFGVRPHIEAPAKYVLSDPWQDTQAQ